jgi:RHS repeat-associated protein
LSETYACDRLGNLRVKAGVGYEYPAARQPRPHAPIRVGGQPYAYDANGNLTSGGGRTFVWNGWNQLASVSQAGVTETYAYDAAGARVTRTSNGATVVTVADLWERTVGGATTHFYRFGADIIGVRRSDQGTLYLFSDHLGSVSAATTASGALVGMQHYDPWGRVRTGGIGLTARTFTGQRLDATGLLYYHARYYDPTLGRFISPDSIVPEPGNPQSFNRFAYVYNNPLKYTDPTGHWIESAVDIAFIAYDIWDIHQNGLTWDNGLALAADVGGLLLPGLTGGGMLVRAVARGNEALGAARGINTAVNAAPAANLADNIHAAGQLRYLRHADPVAFETLMGLGARNGDQIFDILNSAGSDAVIRGITDRVGHQIMLLAGNRDKGLRHVLGRHLTGDIPGGYTTFFSKKIKVGDVVDLIAQTVQNGERVLDETRGNWIYRWRHETWGWITVVVNQAGEVVSAYPK